MRHRLLTCLWILATGVLWFAASYIAFGVGYGWGPDPDPTPTRIEEDDPAWDCPTMGNLICGNEVYAP